MSIPTGNSASSLVETGCTSFSLSAASLQRAFRVNSCLHRRSISLVGLRLFLFPEGWPLLLFCLAGELLLILVGAIGTSRFSSHASILTGISEHSLLWLELSCSSENWIWMPGRSGDCPRRGVTQDDDEDDITQRSGDRWRGVAPGEDEAEEVTKQFLGDTPWRGAGISQVEDDEAVSQWCSWDRSSGVTPDELEDEESVTQWQSGDSPRGGVGVTQGEREEDTPDEVEWLGELFRVGERPLCLLPWK